MASAWQAYLFWVINVEPKKINPSLAYDLYPELRNQSWLQSGEGIKVYQEHRAQELTEVMWRHQLSPWRERIELHGNRIDGHISNAAFIRSLMVSFVRKWGKEERLGGLFGSLKGEGIERVLPWKRSQQAAFLIACWQSISDATNESNATWAKVLNGAARSRNQNEELRLSPAFSGPHTLLATDQGARAVMVVFNALNQICYSELDLEEWESENVSDSPEDDDVTQAANELKQLKKPNSFLKAIAVTLVARVDWRTPSAPGLSTEERNAQSIYRGSSGYTALQSRCFEALLACPDQRVATAAKTAISLLKR